MSRSKAASARSPTPIALLADKRRGDRGVAEIETRQIDEQLSLAVDRVMSEGSLYDREIAALAIKQARGDLIEAIFLAARLSHDAAALRLRRAARHAGDGASAAASRRPSRICPAARCSGRPSTTPIGCSISRSPRTPTRRRRRPRRPRAARPMPRVADILRRRRPDREAPPPTDGAPVGRPHPRPDSNFPPRATRGCRTWRAATKASCSALGYSTQRGYGRNHPFVGEIRLGEVEVEIVPPRSSALPSPIGDDRRHRMPDGQPVQGLGRRRRRNSPAATASPSARASARRWRWRWSIAPCARDELGEEVTAPAQDEEFVLSHSDNVRGDGLRRSI